MWPRRRRAGVQPGYILLSRKYSSITTAGRPRVKTIKAPVTAATNRNTSVGDPPDPLRDGWHHSHERQPDNHRPPAFPHPVPGAEEQVPSHQDQQENENRYHGQEPRESVGANRGIVPESSEFLL